jgi:hypothetical protein
MKTGVRLVRAIATDCGTLLVHSRTMQGSSEYNITVLIDQKDSERALRAVHSRFYLSDVPIGVGIVGPGLIGGTLIEQLREQVRMWAVDD